MKRSEDAGAGGLAPCHECGYDIPRILEARCPECGVAWDSESEVRQQRREAVWGTSSEHMGRVAIVWFGVLLVYALGAMICSRFDPTALGAVLVGVGSGVAASAGVGLVISWVAPEHERALFGRIWIDSLWWLHAPWLAIGPLTLAGALPALVFRVFNPELGFTIFDYTVWPVFLGWVIFCFVAAAAWTGRYRNLCSELGVSAGPVRRLHVGWALTVWVGCGIAGLMGGVEGVVFIHEVLGPQWVRMMATD